MTVDAGMGGGGVLPGNPGANAAAAVTNAAMAQGNADSGSDIDNLNIGELQADFGQTYGIGLILANKELLVLAYQSQGWTNARWDKQTGRIILGPYTGEVWDANRVAAEITTTKWYARYDGNQRQAQADAAADPASWNRRVKWLEGSIRRAAIKAGADLTGVDVASFAEKMLRDNYDQIPTGVDALPPESLLNAYLAPFVKQRAGGNFAGQGAVDAESLRQKAESYGVTLSDQWYLNAVQGLRAGTITLADLDQEIITNAKSRYAGLANMISPSRTVKDIADPYMEMMAQVLEMNPAMINLDNPDIQNALQVVDPKTGAVRSKSLWEFQMDLRQKPEWTSTTRGRQEMNNASMQMLRDFGFVK